MKFGHLPLAIATVTETPTPTPSGGREGAGSPFVNAALVYLAGAVVLPLLAGLLTYPVLTRTGYGVLPPSRQPALTDVTPESVRWQHFGYSLALGFYAMVAVFIGVPLYRLPPGMPFFRTSDLIYILTVLALMLGILATWYRVTGNPLRALTGIVAHLSAIGILVLLWDLLGTLL